MKSKEYDIVFSVQNIPGFRPSPNARTRVDSSGYSLNPGITGFLNVVGVGGAQSLKDDLEFLVSNSTSFPVEYLGPNDESVDILASPNRIVFNPDCESAVIIPLDDYLQIIDEWITFLESLSFEHGLSRL